MQSPCNSLIKDYTEIFYMIDAALVKVKVTLRLSVSQSVGLGVEPHLGLMTRY
jgi:hypothetical protein